MLQVNAEDQDGLIAGCILCNCAGGMNNKVPCAHTLAVLRACLVQTYQPGRYRLCVHVVQAAADDWRIRLALPLLWVFDWLMAQQRIAKYLCVPAWALPCL